MNKKLLWSAFFGVSILSIYLMFLALRVPSVSNEIFLREVKSKLGDFIINQFDKDKSAVNEVKCSDEKQCITTGLEVEQPGSYGETTWKILFYSKLFQSSEAPELKSFALQRAKELTNKYLRTNANMYSTQAFTFLEAFKATAEIEFLRAFFISTQSLTRDAIKGSAFSQGWAENDHPMNLVRYAEQILLVSDMLNQPSQDLINAINFQHPSYRFAAEHQTRFNWMVENKEVIKSASLEVARRFLDLAKNATNQSRFSALSPKLKESKNAVCWLTFGNAAVWDLSGNPEFKTEAYALLEQANLLEGDFTDKDIFIAQGLLPCLNTYKILAKTDPKMTRVYKNALTQMIGGYWDSVKSRKCSGAGGFIRNSIPSVSFTSPLPSKYCTEMSFGSFTLADNAWMFSTINDTEDFRIYPSN